MPTRTLMVPARIPKPTDRQPINLSHSKTPPSRNMPGPPPAVAVASRDPLLLPDALADPLPMAFPGDSACVEWVHSGGLHCRWSDVR